MVRVRGLREPLVRGKDLGHPLCPGRDDPCPRDVAGDRFQGAVDPAGVRREDDERSRGDRPGCHACDPDRQDQSRSHRPQQGGEPIEARLEACEPEPDGQAPVAPKPHPVVFVALRAERLDDRHRRQRLGREGGDLAVLGPLEPGVAGEQTPVAKAEDGHEGDRGEGDHAHHGVLGERDHDHADDEKTGLRQVAEVAREEVAHLVHVRGDARDKLTFLP